MNLSPNLSRSKPLKISIASGKGGTGKTLVATSLAVSLVDKKTVMALACSRAVIADCDVDAPDLHLILQPTIQERREFFGMRRAFIDESKCGSCIDHCRFDAVHDF